MSLKVSEKNDGNSITDIGFNQTSKKGQMSNGVTANHIIPSSHNDDKLGASLVVIAAAAVFLAISIVLWGVGAGVSIPALVTIGQTVFGVSLATILINIFIAIKASNSN